jgi:hypothetical protein
MKKLVLFKASKMKIIIICYLCSIVMVSFILTLFTDYGYGNEFSSIAFMMFILMLLQYRTLKKSFFHFNKKVMAWKLPSMKETYCIYLKDQPLEISKEWDGIKLKNGEDKIEISSDGLHQNDIDYIYQSLKEYYN